MSVSINGILSHKKLMELKNCGVVLPEVFEEQAEKFFDRYRQTVSENLLGLHKGFFARLFYGVAHARRDSIWMFPDRRDLLEHLIYLEGKSIYISLTKEELDQFTLIHQAAVASERARQVLMCFKYSDQVIVDDDTGFNIDWLLRNAYLLKRLLNDLQGETTDE